MGKFEDLESLQKLKDSGAITDVEFEVEKNKILNENYKSKDTNTDSKSTKAIIGLILGLCGIIAWYIPLFGFPVTILGIVFSGIGLKSNNRNKAIAGLTLSIIFLIVTCINSFLGVILYSGLYY